MKKGIMPSLFVLMIACHLASAQINIVSVVAVDSVIADFPVNFSAISAKNWQFVAYYNKDRNLTVASRKIPEKRWNYKILPTKVGWDNHNYITMAFDRDYNIHVSGNMHADTMKYFKTTKPLDISTFERVLPLVNIADELRSTYPNFMKDAQNRLIFTYRKGGSGNGNTISNYYDEQKGKFSRLTDAPLFDGLNEMSAYIKGPTLGPDGLFHLLWVWRDTPDAETNHDLSYARSKDLIHWETAAGERVTLPITPHKKQFTIDPVPPMGGAINGGNALFFDQKQPIVCYHKYDENGKHQLYLSKFMDGKWRITKVTNWDFRWSFSGSGSLTSELKILSASLKDNNTIEIEYWQSKNGFGRVLVDATSLTPLEDKPVENPENKLFTTELMKPTRSESSVKWLKIPNSDNAKSYFAFRWEAMGIRRFYEKREKPVQPFLMQLYEFSK
ncbi:MAG: BNR repeat-containing protein [Spirosomataceae bacterium]